MLKRFLVKALFYLVGHRTEVTAVVGSLKDSDASGDRKRSNAYNRLKELLSDVDPKDIGLLIELAVQESK